MIVYENEFYSKASQYISKIAGKKLRERRREREKSLKALTIFLVICHIPLNEL